MFKLLVGAIFFICAPSYALLTGVDLGSIVSCSSYPDRNFYLREFAATFGPAVRTEQGATWFAASGELYGVPVKEVFVSTIEMHQFVGVVLSAKPTDLIAKIQTSDFRPTNVYPSGDFWVGSDGRNIMWHGGKDTKMFCIFPTGITIKR